MSVPQPRGNCLILDTGGLIEWAAGRQYTRGVILRAAQRKMSIIVPSVVLAQALRGGQRDTPINRVLKSVQFVPAATDLLARQAGVLLGVTGTTDVVDALIVAEALNHLPAIILTSDPDDIRHLAMSAPGHAQLQILSAQESWTPEGPGEEILARPFWFVGCQRSGVSPPPAPARHRRSGSPPRPAAASAACRYAGCRTG